MIDLLNIQPTTISKTLRDKYILIYSQPKMGKTTFAAQAGALLLAFEQGYNGLSGVKAQPVNKWSEFKKILKQLRKDEVKAMYETVAIDTVSIAYDYCEKYVCAMNGVEKIGDMAWGSGYAAVKQEFEDTLREITKLGYGLILIAHAAKRVEQRGEDDSIEIVSPQLNKRAYEICNGLVDIIGYIGAEYDEVDGSSHRYLYTRSTPTIVAGSRFPYLPGKIKFGYAELTDAICKAIDMSATKDGATIVEDAKAPIFEEEKDFEDVMKEAKEIWVEISEDEKKVKQARRIIKNTMKKDMRLSEFTESQRDMLELILTELQTL